MDRIRPFRQFPLALILVLPLAGLATPGGAAQPDDVLAIQLDTRNEALGRLARDYLSAIQRDSAADLRGIIESRMSACENEGLGIEQWTRRHLDVAEQITTFEEAVVIEDSPLRLEILTSLTPEPGTDEPLEWLSWKFLADPDDPSKFLGVRVVDALPPAQWAPDYSEQCSAADPATALCDRLLRETGAPAFAIAIARLDAESHATITSAIAGVRKVGAPETASLSDPVHIGSCTKSSTAFLMATLVAEGRLDWSDTIGEHLGSDFEIHEAYRQVKLAEVLRHEAGLAGHSADIAEAIDKYSRLDGCPTQQRATYLAEVLGAAPSTPVGETHYSNAGFCLIAHVCERLLGQSYEQAMEQRVFKPLGITTAAYGWPATPAEPDGIWGHETDEETGQLVPFEEDLILGPFLAPAGDLHLSIEDFVVLTLQQLLGPRGQSPLAPASVFAELQRVATGSNYAAGIWVSHLDGHHSLSHAGSTGVHWSMFRVWPELNLAVVVATNRPVRQAQALHIEAVFRALANHAAGD